MIRCFVRLRLFEIVVILLVLNLSLLMKKQIFFCKQMNQAYENSVSWNVLSCPIILTVFTHYETIYY